MSIDIQLSRIDRIYRPGDKVKGAVIFRSSQPMSQQGIKLTVDGSVQLQLSARSVGLFEAFYSSLKPVQLMNYEIDLSSGGKIKSGVTELPFEFQLKPFKTQTLHDTYHGVYVNVQYIITVNVERGMLAKNMKKSLEFIVENNENNVETTRLEPFEFSVSPDTLQNIKQGTKAKIPEFLFEGRLDSTVCNITKPLTGELIIRKCAVDIKSIELQLVRVESCNYMEGEAREATEIQNIQIAEGNVVHELAIPIFMIFPRLFTCSTTISKQFKVEFEVNLIVLFADSHMVTENFPLRLYIQKDIPSS